MISIRSVCETDVRRWMWFGLITLAAIQFYYVREMVAALIIFSVLFAFVAVMAVILFLLDRASQLTLAWAWKKWGREMCTPAHWQGRKITRENSLGTTRI